MSPGPKGLSQDEHAIRTTAAEFVAAWNRNDVKALAACFTYDGDLIHSNGRVGRGRREVERLLTEARNGVLKGSRINMPQRHLRFLTPDIAIADYDCEISGVHGSAGKEAILRGHISGVLSKEGDRWLVAAARPTSLSPSHASVKQLRERRA